MTHLYACTIHPHIQAWLKKYIADGWWRRGGLGVALSMAQGLLLMALVLLAINALATQAAEVTLPETRIVGAFFAVGASVVFLIWIFGYIGIRFTEAAFVRYVSQNVSYTSAIILKRAVKAKLDLGILLMCCLYMPVLYTLIQSVTPITDWNDTLAPVFRKQVNFFVPCYFQAFPPYRQQELPTNTCPVSQFTAADQRLLDMRPNGFYYDANILSCDSLFGITLFVFSTTLVVYAVLGYFYIMHSFTALVSAEFKHSKFVDILDKLIRIREDEENSFTARFPASKRTHMAAVFELRAQYKHFRGALPWLFTTFISTCKGVARGLYKPLKFIIIPVRFLLERLVVVSCLNYESQQATERLLKSQQSARFTAMSAKRLATSSKGVSKKSVKDSNAFTDNDDNNNHEEDMGFSKKAPAPVKQFKDFEDSSQTEDKSLTFSEKIQTSGGLSRKNRAVSFRSSKFDIMDANYEDGLDGDQPEFSFSAKFASIKRR